MNDSKLASGIVKMFINAVGFFFQGTVKLVNKLSKSTKLFSSFLFFFGGGVGVEPINVVE